MSAPAIATESRSHNGSQHLPILLAVLLGVVFFYLGHDPQISTVDGWTPWADSTNTFVSKNMALRGGVYALVSLLGVICVLRKGFEIPRITLLALPVIAYVGWSVMSLAWSHDAGTTVIRIGVMGLTCITAYGFSRVLGPSQWIWLGVLITGAYLVIGVLTELALGTFRPWGSGYRFAGTVHPNEQGSLLTILFFGAYCQARWSATHRGRWLMLTLIGLVFLVLTKSRTACASAIFSIAVLECVMVPTKRSFFIGACLAWTVCAAVFLISASGVDLVGQSTQAAHLGRGAEAEGLNGRIPLWEAVLPFARENLILGYGLDSFWTSENIEHIQHYVHWPARDAHSLYLNMILGLGVIGLSLFLLMIFSAMWRSARGFRQTGDPGYAFLITLLLSLLAFGVLEVVGALTSLDAVIVCCGIAYMAFEAPRTQVSFHRSIPDVWPASRPQSQRIPAFSQGATR